MTTDIVYLDNAASTPPHPALCDELADIWRTAYANASAAHSLARDLRQRLEQATAEVKAALDAADHDLIWTSGGTEANNLAIFGSLPAGSQLGCHLITTETEHPSVLTPMKHLEHRGIAVSRLPVDTSGAVDLDRLRAELQESTVLVSIGLVQGETGAVQDLPVVRRVLDKHGPADVRLHVDAVQGVGKIPIPWAEARIDLLSMGGHKFHGPGGVGALLVRRGLDVLTQMHGGGQQDNRRSGSLDSAGILAFSRALQLITGDPKLSTRIQGLNRQLRQGLQELPVSVQINSPATASPYILNFSLPGYQGAILMRMLAEKGVIVATGSACSADTGEPSRILTAMGLTRKVAFGALRVSFGIQNTPADVDRLLTALREALADY